MGGTARQDLDFEKLTCCSSENSLEGGQDRCKAKYLETATEVDSRQSVILVRVECLLLL